MRGGKKYRGIIYDMPQLFFEKAGFLLGKLHVHDL
jgi:hypothetical protein